MPVRSRRHVLAMAVGGVGLTAGCVSLPWSDDSTSDPSQPGSGDRWHWFATDVTSEAESYAATYSNREVLQTWPGVTEDDELTGSFVEEFDVTHEDIEATLEIEQLEGPLHSLAFGSFDPDTVVGDDSVDGEYEGFTVFESGAVDASVIIVGPSYETLIDAGQGRSNSIVDLEGWNALIDSYGDGPLVRLSKYSFGIDAASQEGNIRRFRNEGESFVIDGAVRAVDEEAAESGVTDLQDFLNEAGVVYDIDLERIDDVVHFEYWSDEPPV